MLTERQSKILDTIIKEYVETAEPVGSEHLVQKHQLEVSPATIRNEMALLTNEGYLSKPHTSAGRVPTALGFRFYIKELMQEEVLPVVSEVTIKQRLWEGRVDLETLLRTAVLALADEVRLLAWSATDDRRLYFAGASHILNHPEFFDIDVTRAVLQLLDETASIFSILNRVPVEQDFGLLLGDETGLGELAPCGIVFGRFVLPRGRRGNIAVLGPVRMPYAKVIPIVKYFRGLINELGRNW